MYKSQNQSSLQSVNRRIEVPCIDTLDKARIGLNTLNNEIASQDMEFTIKWYNKEIGEPTPKLGRFDLLSSFKSVP